VIKTGGKTPLTSPIYLSNLFIGSCGTLGIITEATIKVCRVPDHRSVDIIIFEKLGDAINVAYEVLNQGLSPESLIIDDGIRFKAYRDKISYLRDKEKTKEIGPDIGAVVISFTGSREVVKTCRDLAINIMKNKGGKLAPQEVTKAWWDTKHTLNYNPFSTAHKAIRIGTYFDSTVPVDKILELRRKFNERCEKYGFDNGGLRIFMPNLVNCFQVGVNDLDEKSIKLHRKFRDEHIKTALELGGTAITFLGLGEGRAEFLRLKYGETTYNFMKRLKKVLDPKNILNPGKLF
jgi:FAD/FMN-containing dehydrogenase